MRTVTIVNQCDVCKREMTHIKETQVMQNIPEYPNISVIVEVRELDGSICDDCAAYMALLAHDNYIEQYTINSNELEFTVHNDGTYSDYDLFVAALANASNQIVFIRILSVTPKYLYESPYAPAKALTIKVRYEV